ncbi:MAG TPA: beta-N-acetylhexosaminidase, partial [Sphaerochaeta sp.]|nr:beta-N-acetylhexosaminidase [Sphaerochaeta sp.]
VADLASELLALKRGGEDILFTVQKHLAEEEYILSITPNRIVVKASTSAGAFRGFSTLRRLFLGADDQLIPAGKIADAPSFEWRGFMLDCSRHVFTPEFIKKMIDIASLFGLNRFHWHLTDDQGWRIPIEGYPRLESIASKRILLNYTDGRTYGQMYTKKEIAEVEAYARKRHMIVIPEIETPGHASALLAAYPDFGCTKGPYEVQDRWGIFDEVMCVGNDDLLTFLEEAIKQIAELFSGPYIHIGGDEAPRTAWESCPACRQRIEEEHLSHAGELQGWMTSKVARMVANHGKKAIGWDEILDGTEHMGLPKDLIVQSWRGIQGGVEAAKRGHHVVMSPNTEGCYLDYKHIDSEEEMGNLGVSTIEQVARFTPVPPRLDEEVKSHVLGAQVNLWTEKVTTGRQAEYMLGPRLLVMAQQLWCPQEPEKTLAKRELLERFCDKLDLVCYRGPST